MSELSFTPTTVIILLIIAAWAVWAIRRLVHKGMCDCHSRDGEHGCTGCNGCHMKSSEECNSCKSAEKMVVDFKALTRSIN